MNDDDKTKEKEVVPNLDGEGSVIIDEGGLDPDESVVIDEGGLDPDESVIIDEDGDGTVDPQVVDPDVDTEVDPEVVDPEIVDPPEVVDPEVVDPEVVDPVDPEIKPEPQGPIDPDGPLGNLRETGRMGPPLTNEQHDAFGLVQESVYAVLMEVLPKHGLDATGHWLISNTDDASDRLPVDIYLTWAVITGNLETSDQLHYGFYGESIMRDEGNFAAALDEAFAQMLAMDIIA